MSVIAEKYITSKHVVLQWMPVKPGKANSEIKIEMLRLISVIRPKSDICPSVTAVIGYVLLLRSLTIRRTPSFVSCHNRKAFSATNYWLYFSWILISLSKHNRHTLPLLLIPLSFLNQLLMLNDFIKISVKNRKKFCLLGRDNGLLVCISL